MKENSKQKTYWTEIEKLPEMTESELKEKFEQAMEDGDYLTAKHTMKELKSRDFDSWMVDSPEIHVVYSEYDGAIIDIKKFEDFDQWACMQDPLWNYISKKCRSCSDEVRFKIISRALMLRNMEMMKNLTR